MAAEEDRMQQRQRRPSVVITVGGVREVIDLIDTSCLEYIADLEPGSEDSSRATSPGSGESEEEASKEDLMGELSKEKLMDGLGKLAEEYAADQPSQSSLGGDSSDYVSPRPQRMRTGRRGGISIDTSEPIRPEARDKVRRSYGAERTV